MITAVRFLYAKKWKILLKIMEITEIARLTSLIKIKTLYTCIANWKSLIDFMQEMVGGKGNELVTCTFVE